MTERRGGLQCVRLQRIRHDWETNHLFSPFGSVPSSLMTRCMCAQCCMLVNSPYQVMSFRNIFSSPVACLLILLTLSFMEWKFLILMSPAYQFFLSRVVPLVLYLKSDHHSPGHLGFLLYYLLGVLQFLQFYIPCFELNFVRAVRSVPIRFLHVHVQLSRCRLSKSGSITLPCSFVKDQRSLSRSVSGLCCVTAICLLVFHQCHIVLIAVALQEVFKSDSVCCFFGFLGSFDSPYTLYFLSSNYFFFFPIGVLVSAVQQCNQP